HQRDVTPIIQTPGNKPYKLCNHARSFTESTQKEHRDAVIRMLASSKRLLAALLTLAAVARCAQQEVRERPFHRIQLTPRLDPPQADAAVQRRDRKSTRLNSS